jgi:hypothetical protein
MIQETYIVMIKLFIFPDPNAILFTIEIMTPLSHSVSRNRKY